MQPLRFSSNWNGKLNEESNYFSTIRLYNPSRYYVGVKFEVFLNKDLACYAEVINIKTLYLHEVNEFIAALDAGLSVIEFIALMNKFYPKADWKTQKLQFILLRKDETSHS